LQGGLTVQAYLHPQQTELSYFTYDSLSFLLLLVLLIIAIPAIFHSHIYLVKHQTSGHSSALYFAAIVLLLGAISAAYLSNHIAVTWIFTEITTLSASALIYHHRHKLALEGTWKYVFICAISVTFIFIGILFLSLSLQSANSNELTFQNLYINSAQLNPFWLRLSFLFIFTGYTAKIGLVPMFTAGVDAKDEAPSPAGALLSSVLMNMGFVGIYRFYIILANTNLHDWANLVIGIAAFLSIFVATVYLVKVKNFKRMMAYSSVEHMGIIMLGIATGGIGYYAAILHLILHSFVKSSMFLQFSQIHRVFQSKNIYDMGNYFKYNPAGAIMILLGFISVTAMPPSGLFVSEFLIFQALFEAHQILLLIVVLLLLTMIIWAFGKNIMKLLFIPVADFDNSQVPKFTAWESASQFILLALAVYLGLNPPSEFISLIKDSIHLLPN
jgi:hydrogenase-4 component F